MRGKGVTVHVFATLGKYFVSVKYVFLTLCFVKKYIFTQKLHWKCVC
jgi:hypothetical protein